MKVSSWIIAVWLGSLLFSCVTTDSKKDEEPTGLWEVRKGNQKSYLMGTIHVGVAFSSLPAIFQSKLNQSEVVITEVDPWEMTQEEIIQHSFLPQEKKLDELLGYFYWLKLKNSLPEIPEPFLNRMKPSTATIILLGNLSRKEQSASDDPSSTPVVSTHGEEEEDEEDEEISMDVEISSRARNANKNLVYLETTLFQMQLLEKIYDIPALKDLLDNLHDIDKTIAGTVVSYKEGTMADTLKLINEMPEKQRELFLYERNRRWSQILPRFFDRGNAFVAVGLGHLVGDQGLLELLRRKGFSVKRVHSGMAVPSAISSRGRIAR